MTISEYFKNYKSAIDRSGIVVRFVARTYRMCNCRNIMSGAF